MENSEWVAKLESETKEVGQRSNESALRNFTRQNSFYDIFFIVNSLEFNWDGGFLPLAVKVKKKVVFFSAW